MKEARPSYQQVSNHDEEQPLDDPEQPPDDNDIVLAQPDRKYSVVLSLLISFLMLFVALVLDVRAQRKSLGWVAVTDLFHENHRNNDDDSSSLLHYVTDEVGNSGLQGLALDGTVLYECHTNAVRVLRLHRDKDVFVVQEISHSRVYNFTADFPLIHQQNVAHIGGVDIAHSKRHGTELWMATHSEGLRGEGALWAVDPVSLDPLPNRFVAVPYNLDWVAYHEGVLYFGTFFNVTSVQRVDSDTLQPMPDLSLTHLPDPTAGLQFIQSAAVFDNHLVLLSDDYQCTIYYIDLRSGEVVGSQGLLLGSETDGITFDPVTKTLLVGFNRQHSHEQVMGQPPMISIIQLKEI